MDMSACVSESGNQTSIVVYGSVVNIALLLTPL